MNSNEIIKGEVVYVRSDEYLVDISTGSDVSLPFSETVREYKVGDYVDIIIIDVVKGEQIASEKRVDEIKKRMDLEQKLGDAEVVNGKIVNFRNGQFIVELEGGLEGVCYIKNLESFFIKDGEEYIGKEYDFNIIGIKHGRTTRYELSREKIVNEKRQEQQETFEKLFQVGSKLTGKVQKHIKSGIKVETQGFECFIPKSEISYKLLSELPEIESEVEYEVIRTEPERLNTVGSIKKLLKNPWDQMSKYNTKDTYEAPIVRIEDYGVFVELGEDLSGLIHISELSHDFIDDTSVYNIGDIQEFKILEIDNENNKVKLSTKAIYPSKYSLAKEEFTIGQHLVLPVTKFYRSGIFVNLMEKYDVFVKNEEIHNHTQVRPMLKVGSKLDFIITDFIDENEEIKLSNQAYVEKETQIFEEALS